MEKSGKSFPLPALWVSVQGDQVTFTVEGSGHGVGMSQEGAQGMALEGYDHHEILTHYYTGISFADVYKS